MTKEDFQIKKQEIIDRLGKPEFDYDQSPLNEAARELKLLKEQSRREGLKAKLAETKALDSSLTDFVKQVPEERLRRAMNKALPPMYLEEHDLKMFDELEASIIKAHYEDRSLSHGQLGNRFNVPHQRITKLFNSRDFMLLKLKYWDREVPQATRESLLHLLYDNDQKTTLRMAEDQGIIKAEKMDLNVSNKPIEDPEISKLLRELGDKLANDKKESN